MGGGDVPVLNTLYLVSFWEEQWRSVWTSCLGKLGSLSVKPALQLKFQHPGGPEELRVGVIVECINTTGIRVQENPFLMEIYDKYDYI